MVFDSYTIGALQCFLFLPNNLGPVFLEILMIRIHVILAHAFATMNMAVIGSTSFTPHSLSRKLNIPCHIGSQFFPMKREIKIFLTLFATLLA